MNIEKLKMKMMNSGWDSNTLELGIRSEFKCEYCGCDFFSSVNDYDSIQREHIIPTILGGADTLNNLALVCKTCNYIKKNWNPLLNQINPMNREELLASAQKYILEKRKLKEKRMIEEKDYASQILYLIKNTSNNK